MGNELTTSGDGLRLFFTDDIYLVDEPSPAKGLAPEGVDAQQNVQMPATPVAALPVFSEPSVGLTKTSRPKVEYKYLGNNKRNILILVNDAAHDVSDENGRELLRKILKSVNLSTADFALLNYHRYQESSYAELMAHFASTIVFAFGVSPLQLGLNQHPLNAVVREGEVMLVFAAELKQLDADLNGKKALWGCLKQLGL